MDGWGASVLRKVLPMPLIGDARVSTADEDPASRRDAPVAAGGGRISEDRRVTEAAVGRPGPDAIGVLRAAGSPQASDVRSVARRPAAPILPARGGRRSGSPSMAPRSSGAIRRSGACGPVPPRPRAGQRDRTFLPASVRHPGGRAGQSVPGRLCRTGRTAGKASSTWPVVTGPAAGPSCDHAIGVEGRGGRIRGSTRSGAGGVRAGRSSGSRAGHALRDWRSWAGRDAGETR